MKLFLSYSCLFSRLDDWNRKKQLQLIQHVLTRNIEGPTPLLKSAGQIVKILLLVDQALNGLMANSIGPLRWPGQFYRCPRGHNLLKQGEAHLVLMFDVELVPWRLLANWIHFFWEVCLNLSFNSLFHCFCLVWVWLHCISLPCKTLCLLYDRCFTVQIIASTHYNCSKDIFCYLLLLCVEACFISV